MAEVQDQLAVRGLPMHVNDVENLRSAFPADNDNKDEMLDDSLSEQDEIEQIITRLSSEEVSTLLEPAISRAASHYKSVKTPAVEKAMILEEAGDYFEGGNIESEVSTPEDSTTPKVQEPRLASATIPESKVSTSPPPQEDSPSIPISPWQAGPKTFRKQEDSPTNSRSILQGVFSNRARSLSGGAQKLRKILPKGVPSISSVSNIFSLSSSGPPDSKLAVNGSSLHQNKATKVSGTERPSAFQTSSDESAASAARFKSVVNTKSPNLLNDEGSIADHYLSPKNLGLRRSTSDDVLYQSLSRASSLGDDARFEDQTEMVNSRTKAIRDSWQDRTSFRMPQIPSIPSMPRMSNVSFTKNTLRKSSTSSKQGTKTDNKIGILSSHLHKKKDEAPPSPPLSMSPDRSPGLVEETIRSAAASSNTEIFDRAIASLTGDIVIMGGYRGSILRSAKTHRQVWVPVKVGLNIRKVDLEVGLDPEDDEKMEDSIYPSGMLQNIGPVDLSRRLFKRLRESENARQGKLRVWDYGYDWRLSPHLLSKKLTSFLQKLPSNGPGGEGAFVIAHSLGGLITRHVINQSPQLVSGVIYAGTPHGCVNILGPLRNGDAVMLSSRVLTAQVNFTLRTSFLLLPEDGQCFIDINTKERYPIDFFNVDDWIKYRLSPCTDHPLPPRNVTLQSQGPFESLRNRASISQQRQKSLTNSQTSANNSDQNVSSPQPSKTTRATDILHNIAPGQDRTIGMQMDNNKSQATHVAASSQSVSTTVTIPRVDAISYLTRVLAATKTFKQELHFRPALEEQNLYPPTAIIYGKSIPTVFGAKVDGREGIPCSDCYDNLAFASGDGVCLAKEAMLPKGYKCVGGGRVNTDRGHITLLGDLNAVGKAIEAVRRGRERGIGMGLVERKKDGQGKTV